MMELTIRKYGGTEKEKHDIIGLLNEVFVSQSKRFTSREHWIWQFEKNPINKRFIYLAYDKSILAGHYAVSPILLKAGDLEDEASLSTATVTKEGYRGRGIFGQLAVACYSELRTEGNLLTFGFPNKWSVAGCEKKLGWKILSKPPVLLRIARPFRLATTRFRLPINEALADKLDRIYGRLIKTLLPKIGAYKISCIDYFGKEYDELWERVKNQFKIAVVRNSQYLNWRYLNKPNSRYIKAQVKAGQKVVGYCIGMVEKRFGLRIGYIIDILHEGTQRKAIHALASNLEEKLSREGADIITCLSYDDGPYSSLFKRRFYVRLREKLFPQEIFFGGLLHRDDLEDAFIWKKSNWHLSWGDLDVV